MKTNNVNYNLNPVFGTKLRITRFTPLGDSLIDALHGGFTSQGRGHLVDILLAEEGFVVPGKTHMEAFAKFRSEKQVPGEAGILHSEIKQFFNDADKIDLTKRLRFVVEGAQGAVKRFVSALTGGLKAQEVSQGIAHNSKRTFIAIGDEAQELFNLTKRPYADFEVEDFFRNAQEIHVTE